MFNLLLTILLSPLIIYVLYKFMRYAFIDGRKANLNIDLKGKTVLITGASDGIGVATAEELAKMGANVIFACRNFTKTMPIIERIQKDTQNYNLEFMKLDLADFDSISTCAKILLQRNDKIDIIINNAGGTYELSKNRKTKQGYEMMFGVNYLGHYLLNRLLIEKLIESKGRLVIVSSDGHRFVRNLKDFKPEEHAYYSSPDVSLTTTMYEYGFSKLDNVWHSLEMHKRYNQFGVTVNSLHPGAIDTSLAGESSLKKYIKPFMTLFCRTPFQGSQTTLHVATSPNLKNVSGKFFSDCQIVEETDIAKSEEFSKILWDWSEKEVMEKCDLFKQKYSK
eukprot:gene4988-8586_t